MKIKMVCIISFILTLDITLHLELDDCKETIGSVLYPALCSTFFSSSISHTSVDLRCTVRPKISLLIDKVADEATEFRAIQSSLSPPIATERIRNVC